jgi:Leucine-rich repeat (LRR) protein
VAPSGARRAPVKGELANILAARPAKVLLHGARASDRHEDDELAVLGDWAFERCTLVQQRITKLPPLPATLKSLALRHDVSLTSLAGIERLTSLQSLELVGVPGLDLTEVMALLVELPELTQLELDGDVPLGIAKLPSLLELTIDVASKVDLAGTFATLGKITTLRNLALRSRAKKLPPPVGAMTGLVKLSLEGSDFTSLPAEIGKLERLEELSIKYTQIATLPDELCACAALRVLDADDSQLKTLPAQIGKLQHLRELHLWTKTLRSLPESIGDLAELRALHLPYAPRPKLIVPASIYKLRLETFAGPREIREKLTMRPPPTPEDDRVWIHDADRIPDDFGDPIELEIMLPEHTAPLPQLSQLRRLKSLSLEVGDLDGALRRIAGAEHLTELAIKGTYTSVPDSLGKLEQLESLVLESGSATYTSEPGTLKELPAAIAKLARLKTLVIGRHAMTKLPDAIGALAALEHLKLRVEGLAALPETLGALSHLRELELDEVAGLKCLPQSLARCTALERFTIWRSQDEALAVKNLELLGTLPALKSLSLGQLRGVDIESLVDALASRPLEALDLRYTKIRKLPASIGALRKLQRLELASTDVEKLPASLRDCTELRWISLPHSLARAENLKDQLPAGRWKKNFRSHVTWYERSA